MRKIEEIIRDLPENIRGPDIRGIYGFQGRYAPQRD
jgi:hypothetical protein